MNHQQGMLITVQTTNTVSCRKTLLNAFLLSPKRCSTTPTRTERPKMGGGRSVQCCISVDATRTLTSSFTCQRTQLDRVNNPRPIPENLGSRQTRASVSPQ